MIELSRAIHGSRSSREFQTSARRPPGRSTRAISGSASSWSNQWNACAETTTSAEPAGSGIASALPSSARTSGSTDASSRAHLVERLDRGHAVAERDERAGQLARARAEIDDVARLVAHEPADGLLRVSGAPALVRAGDVRERRVRAAHLRIAVDDHRVECRPLPTPLVSTQPGDPARLARARSRRRRRAARRSAERRRGRSPARRTRCPPRARARSP